MEQTLRENRTLDEWIAAFEQQRGRSDAAVRFEKLESEYRGDFRVSLPGMTIDEAEEMYGDDATKPRHYLVAELIDSEKDASVPAPVVKAQRVRDSKKARIIERMLEIELDRIATEDITDLAAVMTLTCGSSYHQLLYNWQTSRVEYDLIHPKAVIAQYGIATSPEDMSEIFIMQATTKEEIKRVYDIDVDDEGEQYPWIKGTGYGKEDMLAEGTSDEFVTLITAWYRNKDGGVGKYSWAGTTEIENEPNYMQLKTKTCKQCGEMYTGDICPKDGSGEFELNTAEDEPVTAPIRRSDGSAILPETVKRDKDGQPIARENAAEILQYLQQMGQEVIPELVFETEQTVIPQYHISTYPIILQKNIPVYGRLDGESDVERISYLQTDINTLSLAARVRALEGGTLTRLPTDPQIGYDAAIGKVIRMDKIESLVEKYDMSFPVDNLVNLMAQYKQLAQTQLNISQSFRGMEDKTAESGIAKQIQAEQSAGRLYSKRQEKLSAFSKIYEIIFKYHLAYDRDPIKLIIENEEGEMEEAEFNRYDFLDETEDGWVWNDDYTFSASPTKTLGQDRSAIWAETTQLFQMGIFGAMNTPDELTNIDSRLMYMEILQDYGYPIADKIITRLKRRAAQLEQERQQQQQMMAQQQQAQQEQAQQAQYLQQYKTQADIAQRQQQLDQGETKLAMELRNKPPTQREQRTNSAVGRGGQPLPYISKQQQ